MRYEFVLKGQTPLLMHADDVEWSDHLEAWRKDPAHKKLSRAGDDRSPPWTWVGYAYNDGENFAMPGDNLAVAIRQAGSRVTMRGMKTFKEEAVSGIFVEDEYLPVLVNGNPVPMAPFRSLAEQVGAEFSDHLATAEKHGFKLFMKRAKIGTSKHVRVRPRFDTWEIRGAMMVDSDLLKLDILQSIFQIAGRIGIGSWRPGGRTPGRYGMFAATIKPTK